MLKHMAKVSIVQLYNMHPMNLDRSLANSFINSHEYLFTVISVANAFAAIDSAESISAPIDTIKCPHAFRAKQHLDLDEIAIKITE